MKLVRRLVLGAVSGAVIGLFLCALAFADSNERPPANLPVFVLIGAFSGSLIGCIAGNVSIPEPLRSVLLGMSLGAMLGIVLGACTPYLWANLFPERVADGLDKVTKIWTVEGIGYGALSGCLAGGLAGIVFGMISSRSRTKPSA